MCDNGYTSPNNPLLEESEYHSDCTRPTDAYPSPPQDAYEEVCVCNLNVKFLLEQGSWVGNSRNLYEPVGQCNSFHEEVTNNYFPYLLGGKCVEIGEISGDEDVEDEGVNLEYLAENKDVQCLACARNGKYTKFSMYQSILRYEAAKDGYTRPRLAWFIDFYEQSREYCCVLWRIDGKAKAEDGAVFGIWGNGGPHEKLTFRIASKRKSLERNKFHCLQARTSEQLLQFIKNNGVYMASIKEAESALRQQLETFTKPQWETYGRWRFPEGVPSSTDSLDAYCAACYSAPTSELRCKGIIRLRKLSLKPLQHKEYRILAYRVNDQSKNAKFVFFSKRRDDDTLRFLKTDGNYTDFALRFIRYCHSLSGPHENHSSCDTTRQKRLYHSIDQENQPFQKRAHTNTRSFKPINEPQNDERVSEPPSSYYDTLEWNEHMQAASTGHDTGCFVSENNPKDSVGPTERLYVEADQSGHVLDSSSSRYHAEEETAPLISSQVIIEASLNTEQPSTSYPSAEPNSHLDNQQAELDVTWESIRNERIRNKQLELIKMKKQEELMELKRQLQEKERKKFQEELECEIAKTQVEAAEIAQLDAQIEMLRQRLQADVGSNTAQTVLD